MQILFCRWQRQHSDSFLYQLNGFSHAGLTADRTLLGVPVVDFAGFVGEALSDILHPGHLLTQRLDHFREDGGRIGRCILGERRRGSGGGRGACNMRRRRASPNLQRAADGAGHQTPGALFLKRLRRGEPAFELVRMDALQIQHDHSSFQDFLDTLQR